MTSSTDKTIVDLYSDDLGVTPFRQVSVSRSGFFTAGSNLKSQISGCQLRPFLMKEGQRMAELLEGRVPFPIDIETRGAKQPLPNRCSSVSPLS
jgi:hypothetical protein